MVKILITATKAYFFDLIKSSFFAKRFTEDARTCFACLGMQSNKGLVRMIKT